VIVEAQATVRASTAAIWTAITDIENAARIVRGIERIEILERPRSGLVGLKWRETRLLFGKPESVEKWITEAVDGEHYETRAQGHGFVFVTTMRLSHGEDGIVLTSSHDSRPQGFRATLQTIPMRLFFKGVIRKAIRQDLDDIKMAVEHGAA
jgi:hypothetical protein